MKSILKAFSAVALTGVMVLPVLADDATTTTDGTDSKDLKKVIEDQGINYVETAQKGITLSGYVDTSYTQQFIGSATTTSNGAFTGSSPLATGNSGSRLRQFDNSSDGFNVQAVKIALEKALPDKNEWAAGFRIDTIYGADANLLKDSAFNTTSTGLALEQALVKFRIPVGNGLDIYAGKFVTFLGYEVIESPANPNFSRGLLFTNAIPLTHTGVYADYKFSDTFEAKFGVVDGWNNSQSQIAPGSDYAFGGKSITGQLNINAPGKNANITQSFIYTPQDTGGVGEGTGQFAANGGIFVYDIWGNWTPTFDKNGNTTLGFNIDYGDNGNAFYGIALYAQYKLTKVITLAARGEYLHCDSSFDPKFTAVAITPGSGIPAPTQDDFAETLTASFAIWDNLLTRVEYRYDYISEGGHTDQNQLSLEAVYSF